MKQFMLTQEQIVLSIKDWEKFKIHSHFEAFHLEAILKMKIW